VDTTEFAPFPSTLAKDMCCDWFFRLSGESPEPFHRPDLVTLMSSLAAFRSLRVVKKLGDEIFGS
jgi:hypothetical protein